MKSFLDLKRGDLVFIKNSKGTKIRGIIGQTNNSSNGFYVISVRTENITNNYCIAIQHSEKALTWSNDVGFLFTEEKISDSLDQIFRSFGQLKVGDSILSRDYTGGENTHLLERITGEGDYLFQYGIKLLKKEINPNSYLVNFGLTTFMSDTRVRFFDGTV